MRSARRRRTVQARLVEGKLVVRVPAGLSAEEERHWVRKMLDRFERMEARSGIDPMERAATLSRRYGLRRPGSVRWVSNQAGRWGSCSPHSGAIRLSDRLASLPTWVIDYVIVHELAHLDHPAHDGPFWETVGRYPLSERARGFLMALDRTAEASGEEAEGEACIDAGDLASARGNGAAWG